MSQRQLLYNIDSLAVQHSPNMKHNALIQFSFRQILKEVEAFKSKAVGKESADKVSEENEIIGRYITFCVDWRFSSVFSMQSLFMNFGIMTVFSINSWVFNHLSLYLALYLV